MTIKPLKTYEKDFQIPLQYLAAAALIHWQEIPEEVRDSILKTAEFGGISGLPPTTSLHEQLKILVRHSGP